MPKKIDEKVLEPTTTKQGFAVMDADLHRQICSAGGRTAHAKGTAHEFTSEQAKVAGAKGGATVSADRAHMAEIGRKGGLAVSRDKKHMAEIGQKGGKAISTDRDHMMEIGKKGVEAKTKP